MEFKNFVFADKWYYFLIAAVVCYFVGCFNSAIFISHIKKKDIRSIGSGNPGTMNMTRTFGFKVGVINFFCDAIKGGIPVLAAYLLFRGYKFSGTDFVVSDFARYFFGIFVVIGHVFPVTFKFKGGKGIASTMGMYLFALTCEKWWYIFIVAAMFAFFLSYIVITEWGSIGSLMGVAMLTIFQAVIFVMRYANALDCVWMMLTFGLLLSANLITWIAHHKNILRLMTGEEHRTVVLKHK